MNANLARHYSEVSDLFLRLPPDKNEDKILKVISDTGMGWMQAKRHVEQHIHLYDRRK